MSSRQKTARLPETNLSHHKTWTLHRRPNGVPAKKTSWAPGRADERPMQGTTPPTAMPRGAWARTRRRREAPRRAGNASHDRGDGSDEVDFGQQPRHPPSHGGRGQVGCARRPDTGRNAARLHKTVWTSDLSPGTHLPKTADDESDGVDFGPQPGHPPSRSGRGLARRASKARGVSRNDSLKASGTCPSSSGCSNRRPRSAANLPAGPGRPPAPAAGRKRQRRPGPGRRGRQERR